MTLNRIQRNPAILGGKPCIAGTRIPVTMILELLEDGLSFDDIIRDYYPQLSADDIRACLEYAKAVLDNEEIYFTEEASFNGHDSNDLSQTLAIVDRRKYRLRRG